MPRWLRAAGRGLTWPVRATGRALGRAAVEGAISAIAPPAEPVTLPAQQGGSMLGVNKDTNLAGWLHIAWQVLQIIGLITGHPIPGGVTGNLAGVGAISAFGNFTSKDAKVTGAGETAQRVD